MRAIASVTLSFGLVSIPVKLYSATDAAAAIRFKLMSRAGARVRQQYVADAQPEPVEEHEAEVEDDALHAVAPQRRATSASIAAGGSLPPSSTSLPVPPLPSATPAPMARYGGAVPPARAPSPPPADHDDDDDEDPGDEEPAGPLQRHEMVRGYEFEKGRYVLFTPAELKALQEAGRDSVDIVAFIPAGAVDPIYYDKAYLVAPDKRGEKTYALLLQALHTSGRTALARWAWKGKELVVQVRPADGGLVLQQLFYADEVRLPQVLGLKLPAVGETELQLALKLIEQGSQPAYDPAQFVDEEKQRILAAVERKIAGGSVITHRADEPARPSGQVIDLLDALRASLRPAAAPADRKPPARAGAKGTTKTGAVAQFPAKAKPAAKPRPGRQLRPRS